MSHLAIVHRRMNQLRIAYRLQREFISDANKIINQGSPAFLPKTIEFAEEMRSKAFSNMNRTRKKLRDAMNQVEAELNRRSTMRAARSTTGYRVGDVHIN